MVASSLEFHHWQTSIIFKFPANFASTVAVGTWKAAKVTVAFVGPEGPEQVRVEPLKAA